MKKKILIGFLVFLLGFMLFNIVQAVEIVPGSDEDPLITSSYLDKKVQEVVLNIETSVNQKIKQITNSISVLDKKVEDMSGQSSEGTGQGFKPIDIPAGKKLTCEASAEIILRAGKAKVVSETGAGLSDVTSGADIKAGEYITKDHLLIVPRTDGRGLAAVANSVVMIKGKYVIE